MQENLVDDPLVAPQPLGDETYEAVAAALLHNVEQGLADPLLGLSEETEEELVALAETDTIRLDRLERRIQDAIRSRGDGEREAKNFKLTTYRKAAKERAQQRARRVALRQKLAARNMRVVDGREEEALDRIDRTAPLSEQADIFSNSAHLQAIGWLRANRKGRVWFDEFHQRFYSDWSGDIDGAPLPEPVEIDDAFLRRVHSTLHRVDTRLAKSSFGNSERALYTFAQEDVRNEPKAWLQSLQWDGVERLPCWLSEVYGTPQDDAGYHAAVGRCWIVSMVARVMKPGCQVDTMPVLFGPQGTGKSQSLAILGGKYYATLNTSAAKDDWALGLCGLMLGEVAELDAISGRRVENSRVKALITTSEDLVRPPYGRTYVTFQRTIVFAGTTNDPGWHRDETGGRRFWPIECVGEIGLEWLRQHRDQLFAEAYSRWAKGEKWWDVNPAEQARRIMEHYSEDPWTARISAWLEANDAVIHKGDLDSVAPLAGDPTAHEAESHWGTLVTTSRLLTECLQVPVERQSRYTVLQVARCLRELDWTSKSVRCRGGRKAAVTRAWVLSHEGWLKRQGEGAQVLDLQGESAAGQRRDEEGV